MRVNISIPKVLKAKMDKVNARKYERVNWSKVASVAFERVCRELLRS